MPQEYDANKNWAGKKVVLVSVPGAPSSLGLLLQTTNNAAHE
jgi:peroxiredoxin